MARCVVGIVAAHVRGLVHDDHDIPIVILVEIRDSQNLAPILLATAVGLAGGIAAILFRYLIEFVKRLFFQGSESVLSFLGDGYVIILPAGLALEVGLPQ